MAASKTPFTMPIGAGMALHSRRTPMDATYVKSIRTKLGLTQEEFAHRLGVSFVTVNKWENSRQKPSKMARQLLANIERPIQELRD